MVTGGSVATDASARGREVRAGELVPLERTPLEGEALQALGRREPEVALEADARPLPRRVRIEANVGGEVAAVAAAGDADAWEERRLLRDRGGRDQEQQSEAVHAKSSPPLDDQRAAGAGGGEGGGGEHVDAERTYE